MTVREDPIRTVLSLIAGAAILGSLSVLVFGIGGRPPRTVTPLEILGYDGQIWLVLVLAVGVLIGGIGLTLMLKRTDDTN